MAISPWNIYKNFYSTIITEEKLHGGKGEFTDVTTIDPMQLEMGIKVEMEHTKDPEIAKSIAIDHLTENPKYYTVLKQCGLADEL